MSKKQKKVLYRLIIAAILLVVASLLPLTGIWKLLCFLVPYFVIGYDVLFSAFHGIVNGQIFDENFLMAIATVGAMAVGDYKESVAVLLFYQLGELFQSFAVGKSRQSITQLMDIHPEYANVTDENGQLEQVDPEEVEVGTEITVLPGERIPIDGVILTGTSTLNTSALTGESLPRSAAPGDEVISGCVNLDGVLIIRTTKLYEDSTVARILELTENSAMKKATGGTVHHPFCPLLYPNRLYLCLGAGHPAADHPVGHGVQRGMGHMDLPCPDLPGHQLPLRAGHLHSADLFWRHRRCVPAWHLGEGCQRPGNLGRYSLHGL